MRMRSRRSRLVTALTIALGAICAGVPAGTIATADVYRDGEWWLTDHRIRDAWSVTKGEGVTIAVIDTGVDGAHPDLAGAVVGGTDVSGMGSADGQEPLGLDGHHGTMVASLAAGRGAGSSGVLGVAPEADLLSVSMSFELNDVVPSDKQIATGVTWAVDNGADIIVMSFTRNSVGWPASWDTAFQYAADHDVLVVAATGNRGSGTEFVGAPATIPGVLVVGGIGEDRVVSSTASAPGVTVGVVAASEGLVGSTPGGARRFWNGTSGAAPIVAGIAALVMSAHPELDVANVINRIIRTATPVGSVPNVNYGYGIVNAQKAVAARVDAVAANPLGDLDSWIDMHREVDWETAEVALAAPDNDPAEMPTGPSEDDLRSAEWDAAWLNAGLPTLTVAGFGVLMGAAVVLAALRARVIRRQLYRVTGEESPDNALN